MTHATKGAASPRLFQPMPFLILVLLAILAQGESAKLAFSSLWHWGSELQLRHFTPTTAWAFAPEGSFLSLFRRAPSPDLTVHEWGTFTSIAGPDGRAIDWLPLSGSTDLPSFVEHFREVNFKGGLRGTVRMETPVLYFYSPQETTVSVDVSFRKGLITEWYPRANSANRGLTSKDFTLYNMKNPGAISWNSVHIDPHAAADFPTDNSRNHYYAARQTSSAPIELSTSAGAQREKFLFYRGVAAFPPPLNATLSGDGTVTLQNHSSGFAYFRGSDLQVRHSFSARTGLQPLTNPLPASIPSASSAEVPASSEEGVSDEIPNVILFERRGERLGYRVLDPLQDEGALAPPSLDGSLDSVCSTLEGALVAQGLFPDEAHAMLETWKNSWFEEGSRLIYIVPRRFVDSVLPLYISPTPANTTRVFVGRLELITPTTQKAVETAFATGDNATLANYSRFLEAILISMVQQTNDEARQQGLLAYLNSLPTP
jgi:hypothetical protein